MSKIIINFKLSNNFYKCQHFLKSKLKNDSSSIILIFEIPEFQNMGRSTLSRFKCSPPPDASYKTIILKMSHQCLF